jgi:hypothetical protein
MVSTCANPRCSAKFLYLHDGTLFSLKSQPTSDYGAAGGIKYFWLCPTCSTTMTLVFDRVTGVRVARKPSPKETAKRVPSLLTLREGDTQLSKPLSES